MQKTLLLLIFTPLFLFAGQLKIMAYNVENLFDNRHDEGKSDFQYLPFKINNQRNNFKFDGCRRTNQSQYRLKECMNTDWTDEKLELKLNQIKDAITCTHKEQNSRGEIVKTCNKALPDVLVLTEVENDNVLAKLQRKLGYSSRIMAQKGSDRRGIDVAMLYNESSELELHSLGEYEINEFLRTSEDPSLKELQVEVKQSGNLKTRSILEAVFKVNNQYLHVYGNHWPSQSPRHHYLERPAFAKMLIEAMRARVNQRPSGLFVATGDFNVIDGDKTPHAFNDILLNDNVGGMIDSHTTYMRLFGKEMKLPWGTYYYRRGGTWNLLDRVFLSPNLVGKNCGLRISKTSGRYEDKVQEDFYQIVHPDFLKIGNVRRPMRYDFTTDSEMYAGYSDHFPIEIKLIY